MVDNPENNLAFANEETPEGEDGQEFVFEANTLEPAPDEIEIDIVDDSFGANLVECLDSSLASEIGQDRLDTLQSYTNAREGWESRIKRGIKWLGLDTTGEGNTEVEGACTAVHPLLIENIIKFQAKAIQELWPAKGPVRTKILGYIDKDREDAATRVNVYMNYQLTEQVSGFYSDLERNLFRVGFMGLGIKKAGWNTAVDAPDPTVVYAENFYVDPAIAHLKDADEYIEVMELSSRRMRQLTDSGHFCEGEHEESEESITANEITQAIAEAQGFDISVERRGFTVGESHCYLDLDGGDSQLPDGGTAPYIVHFNTKSGKVYSIRRNWLEDDAAQTKRLWYVTDHMIPAFGFYSLGYVHLLGDLTASTTAALRALVDAGQLANWQGGFKSQDAKFSNSSTPIGFGEFRDVNISPEELKNAFLPLPAKEPSQVLLELLKFMVASGQKFADAADEVVANGTNYGPAATTLAMLEASQRFYSSIHKRLHQSQQEFFKLLGRLNYENLPDRVNFVVNNANQYVQRNDFNPAIIAVVPASDPNAQSESQRVGRAQIELETAVRFPQIHDMQEVLRRFYTALGVESIDKLLVDKSTQAISADPLTEIQSLMQGKPIKATPQQEHNAHIAVKQLFIQSPTMQGANDPATAAAIQMLNANINEHKALAFMAQFAAVAQQAGLSMESEQAQGLIGQQLLAMQAQQQQGSNNAEQQMIEINKQELQLAAERVRSQDTREAAKIALKNRELDLKQAALTIDAKHKEQQLNLQGAGKMLDNSAKLAQIDQKRLSKRADETSGNLIG